MTRKQALILITLLLGVSLSALDAGIISPALPLIKSRLFSPAGFPELTSWAITIYVLGGVVSAPLMAKLSTIYGRRMIYNETGETDRAPAISASSVFQQGGVLIGTSVIGGILSAKAIILSNQYNTDETNLPLTVVKPVMQSAVQQAFGVIAVSLVISCVVALLFLKSRNQEKANVKKDEAKIEITYDSVKV
jgi:MFS family permease